MQVTLLLCSAASKSVVSCMIFNETAKALIPNFPVFSTFNQHAAVVQTSFIEPLSTCLHLVSRAGPVQTQKPNVLAAYPTVHRSFGGLSVGLELSFLSRMAWQLSLREDAVAH